MRKDLESSALALAFLFPSFSQLAVFALNRQEMTIQLAPPGKKTLASVQGTNSFERRQSPRPGFSGSRRVDPLGFFDDYFGRLTMSFHRTLLTA